jgi:hypothetical protein
MYRHTQVGWIMLLVFGGIIAGAVRFGHWPAAVLCGIVLVLFCSLTVEIDDEEIDVWFGPGLIRRQVRLGSIVRCEPVTNEWWWGWGIRWYGPGTMFNVSGLHAVELELKGGSFFRIGTDEPEVLSSFINRKLTRWV